MTGEGVLHGCGAEPETYIIKGMTHGMGYHLVIYKYTCL